MSKKSNLQITFLSAALSLVLSSQSFAAEKQLSKVLVTADAEKSDGYKANISSTSTRTSTPLLDTPQSISVVTEEQIIDQRITNMSEAARYVPGVVVVQGEANRDQVVIRGNNTTADFFVDGMRDDVQYFRDFYNVENVEFLKGPNAMAFGRGGSGGVINRNLKYADGQEHRRVILTGGSFHNRRFEGDIGAAVNDKLSLRLNAMYEKSGTFRQYGDLERFGINPTAALEVGDSTEVKLSYEHFQDTRFNDRGIPSENGRAFHTDPKTFFGNPDANIAKVNSDSLQALITHDFDSSLQLKNKTRYNHSKKFYQNVLVDSQVENGAFDISAYNNGQERRTITNQTDLIKKFQTGKVKHTALLGGEITIQDTRAARNDGLFNGVDSEEEIFVNNPISRTPISFTEPVNNLFSTTSVYGIFAQDQIDLNKYFQVTAGLRYESFQTDLKDKITGQSFVNNDDLISPKLGLVFKPKDNISLYTSYSVTYLPSSGDQFTSLNDKSVLLKPEKMENYEIGGKWDVNPKLNLSAAVYQLDRKNTRAADPNNSGFFVTTGETRTRGFELGANGKITDKWQLIAAYAFQDAKIESTTSSATAGNRVALVPKSIASLWNKYDFTDKFALGLGIINQSSQFAGSNNTVKLKGYTRFDAAAYYKINQAFKLQLNVENLFDRGYIATAHTNNNLQPGSTRAFKLSLIAGF